MAQQMLIIGLGHFGMSLAATLSSKGVEVIAIDKKRALVEEASGFVDEAVVMDVTDETELVRLEPEKRDACVCAIGDESKEASIICTALLRQMGSKRIIARANSSMLQRILMLVGAHEIVNPEEEFGKRFANRLIFKRLVADMPLGDGLHLSEVAVKDRMIGKSLIQLALPKKYGIMVVAVRRATPNSVFLPKPDESLQENDNLILVSKEDAIKKMMEDR